MTLPELKYDFHDGCLESFVLGPRRELRLRVVLVDPARSAEAKDLPVVEVRFGGIEDYKIVESCFGPLHIHCAKLDVHGVEGL